jgi:hypothetical protein
VDTAKVIQVIEVCSLFGKGEDSIDPVRIIREYYTLDGKRLARVDDWDTITARGTGE